VPPWQPPGPARNWPAEADLAADVEHGHLRDVLAGELRSVYKDAGELRSSYRCLGGGLRREESSEPAGIAGQRRRRKGDLEEEEECEQGVELFWLGHSLAQISSRGFFGPKFPLGPKPKFRRENRIFVARFARRVGWDRSGWAIHGRLLPYISLAGRQSTHIGIGHPPCRLYLLLFHHSASSTNQAASSYHLRHVCVTLFQ